LCSLSADEQAHEFESEFDGRPCAAAGGDFAVGYDAGFRVFGGRELHTGVARGAFALENTGGLELVGVVGQAGLERLAPAGVGRLEH